MQKLSPNELRQVRDWLNDFVEDGLEFTDEFESAIQQSEQATLRRQSSTGATPQTTLNRKP